jgi:small subunit ribosomal protein S21
MASASGQAAIPLIDKRLIRRGLTTWAANPLNPDRISLVQVLVRDNNVDQAMKALKKKLQREGVFREMKLRNFYEKPSEKRAREKAEAIRRARKLARKRAQRESGVAAKPRSM